MCIIYKESLFRLFSDEEEEEAHISIQNSEREKEDEGTPKLMVSETAAKRIK